MSVVSSVVFEQNPPANLRKSNFFSFVCKLFDANNQVLRVSSALCVGFIENNKDTKVLRNGVRYKLKILTQDGTEAEDYIHVIVVDSESNEIVPFQGQDRNPSMTRVLLTHESICSRCAAKKSCGNKNDTPADPVIQDHTGLKVFLKCNQNCLINAGNPRELRKFKLAISGTQDLSLNNWAYSSAMFVHNNSKHGRVTKSKSSPDCLTDPSISLIWPQPGPLCGGRALIVGKNFAEDAHVLFGTTSIHSKVITPDAIQIEVPPVSQSSVMMVTLIQRNQLFQRGWHYTYCSPEVDQISVSPLNLSTSRLAKPFGRHYNEAEQIATFSSMLGINRDRPSRGYAPAPPHSPTYPPPPRKPIAISANTEGEEVPPSAKTPMEESPFSYSKEGSAFNRVRRELVPFPGPTTPEEEAARLETATILQSLKTRSHVSQDYIKMDAETTTTESQGLI
ncbi:transcription factor COE1-like [Bolinopsis microptera]|uniref:transcription factor COE1-like n=1 Tax=Bolinopsis microptera TaxID=2820187 RepID=UPI00307ABBFD